MSKNTQQNASNIESILYDLHVTRESPTGQNDADVRACQKTRVTLKVQLFYFADDVGDL